MYRGLSLLRDADETWRWRGLAGDDNGGGDGPDSGVGPDGGTAAGPFGGGTGNPDPEPSGGSPAGPIDTGRSSQAGTSPDIAPEPEAQSPGGSLIRGVSFGIPGVASVSFSRDTISVSVLGIGVSFDTRGISIGTGAPPEIGNEPSRGFGPDAEGTPGGSAGNPGGFDFRLPPVIIPWPSDGDATGGEAGAGGGHGAGAGVTIPWLWIGAGVGALLLLRSRSPKRR